MGHRTKLANLKGRLASFFKQAVEAPPEPDPEPEPQEPPEPSIPPLEEEFDEIHDEDLPAQHDPDVLDELNSATQRWKQTGDPGLHLETPVPLTERAKHLWNVIAHDVSPKVATALKDKIGLVAHTASAKLQQLQSRSTVDSRQMMVQTADQEVALPRPPTPAQVDSAILESWKEVLVKSEEAAQPNEREEIEKIYKQLSQ